MHIIYRIKNTSILLSCLLSTLVLSHVVVAQESTPTSPIRIDESANFEVKESVVSRTYEYINTNYYTRNFQEINKSLINNRLFIITLRTHVSSGPYFEMAQSLAKLLTYTTEQKVFVNVETGTSTLENIQLSATREDLYIFIGMARDVYKLRQDAAKWSKEHPYQKVRALLSLPPLVLHIITQNQIPGQSINTLQGATVYAGNPDSVTRDFFEHAVGILPVYSSMTLVDDSTVREPLPALLHKAIDAYAIASPMPDIPTLEMHFLNPLGLLNYPQQGHRILGEKKSQIVQNLIPSHGYQLIELDTQTVAEPIGLYTQARLPGRAAAMITQAYWLWRLALINGAGQPWWKYTDTGDIFTLQAPLHHAAIDYYKAAGVPVPYMPDP